MKKNDLPPYTINLTFQHKNNNETFFKYIIQQKVNYFNRQQVYDMQQSSSDTSPESLISRMEEDNQLNNYLVNEKLPKVCVA